MTKEEFDEWKELARTTAWKEYSETVPNGEKLLNLAIEAME
jgi:hypothetical protein